MLSDNRINIILNGDCIKELKLMPDAFINCCVTSPPYWGLRDYGHEGQLGLESTPEEYVLKMVEIFREVKRVLKDSGILWLNLGDTYSAHKDCKSVSDSLRVGGRSESANIIEKGKSNSRNSKMLKSVGLKNKDLIGIPWMVAFALRADGWYLRQNIIWHKPNPMPESVTDRCTKSHEYIFLMSKSQKYYYDNEAIGIPIQQDTLLRYKRGWNGDGDRGYPNGPQNHIRKFMDPENNKREWSNKRSVWTVNTHSYSEAHFATFPEELIIPCIKAGCPEGGVVLDPFMGAGTTALVALKLNRKFIGIELNSEYCDMAENRIKPYLEQGNLFARQDAEPQADNCI